MLDHVLIDANDEERRTLSWSIYVNCGYVSKVKVSIFV